MRPINLIPEEERGLHGGIARTGPFVYVLVGSLAVLLIGVVVLVLTSNKISERESEIASLETQKAAVSAQAAALQPYVSFEQVARRRLETVATLANSRFDWVRVIRQLSMILPPGSSISTLSASSGGTSPGGAIAVATPSMNMVGCAPSQDGTAAVVVALKQIDGVTRVGLTKSSLGGENSGGETQCQEGEAQFELTVSFDEAPISPDASGGEAVVETGTVESGAVSEAESTAEREEEGGEAEGSGETAASSPAGTEGTG